MALFYRICKPLRVNDLAGVSDFGKGLNGIRFFEIPGRCSTVSKSRVESGAKVRPSPIYSTKIRTGTETAGALPSLNACTYEGPRPSVAAEISTSPDSPSTRPRLR